MRHPKLFADVQRHLPLFSHDDADMISAIQVQKFNALWARSCQTFDIYRRLKTEFSLPERIDKIDDVKNFPLLTKQALQGAQGRIIAEAGVYRTASTGGATGTPLVFPVDKRNSYRALRNAAVGRAFHSVELGDPIFLLWGHHHLFGSGWKGRVRHAKRKAADWLNNMQRASAYDLSDKALANISAQLGASDARAVIGYSAAIRRLARGVLNGEAAICTTSERTKWILTSEMILDTDAALIDQAFNGDTVCEYGLSEFGPVAYSRRNLQEIVPFWWSFYIYLDNANRIVVTDLESSAFPFINYLTGDLALPHDKEGLLSKVTGRENDLVTLWMTSGRKILVHSEFFTHVCTQPEILAFQILQKHDAVNIKLRVREGSQPRAANAIRSNLLLEYEKLDLSRVEVTFDYERVTTISGKEKFVIAP
jgi:phenylacetate-coenzyme A ligase PaaK-like adenylate-forming protein